MRETQVNRDATPLLLRQTVGINARERLHQRRLTVVNMARSAYDDGFHSAEIIQASSLDSSANPQSLIRTGIANRKPP
jgi:hypothetical protein